MKRAYVVAGAAWLVLAFLASHASADAVVLGRYSPGYAAVLSLFLVAAIALTALARPGRERLAKRLIGSLVLSFGSLCFALAAAEIFVRVANPIGVGNYEANKQYLLDKEADASRLFRNPVSTTAQYGGIEYRFNALGMRGAAHRTRQPGERRVLAIGDSVTLGWGVTEESTFVAQLEQRLARRDGRPATVMNAGVGGYDTSQEVRWLAELLPQTDPDVVVLLYVINDIDPSTGPFDPRRQLELRGKSPPEQIQVLIGRSWLYRLARHVLAYSGATSGEFIDVRARESAGWRASMAGLREAERLTTAAGVPLIVVFYRWWRTPGSDVLLADLSAAIAPLAVIDTASWHEGKDLLSLRNSVVDSHPNAAGHQILAAGLEDHVVRACCAPSISDAPEDPVD